MTPGERALLVQLGQEVARLYAERDDMIVGFTAAILDTYRANFKAGSDSKPEALQRLQLQKDYLDKATPTALGSKMLASIIKTLEADQLDAAALCRAVPVGRA